MCGPVSVPKFSLVTPDRHFPPSVGCALSPLTWIHRCRISVRGEPSPCCKGWKSLSFPKMPSIGDGYSVGAPTTHMVQASDVIHTSFNSIYVSFKCRIVAFSYLSIYHFQEVLVIKPEIHLDKGIKGFPSSLVKKKQYNEFLFIQIFILGFLNELFYL